MDYRNFISSDHSVMLGKPVIKGTRLTVEMILRKLGEGASIDDVIKMYPGLNKDAIQALLQ